MTVDVKVQDNYIPAAENVNFTNSRYVVVNTKEVNLWRQFLSGMCFAGGGAVVVVIGRIIQIALRVFEGAQKGAPAGPAGILVGGAVGLSRGVLV